MEFSCPICEKKFKNNNALNGHLTAHENKKKYPSGIDCPICHIHKNTLQQFYYHCTRFHKDEKESVLLYQYISNDKEQHVCKVCGKAATFDSVAHGYLDVCSQECREILTKQINKEAKLKVDYVAKTAKFKATCQKRYGCDSPSQCREIRDKMEQTSLDRYGARSPLGSEVCRNKGKATNLKKYGFENPIQSTEIKNLIRANNNKKYGMHPSNLPEVKLKVEKTCIERYGVAHPSQNGASKEASKQTCIKKYGVEFSFQAESQKEKAKQTNIEKYGTEYYLQSQNAKEKSAKTNFNKYNAKFYLSSDNYKNLYKDKEWVANTTFKRCATKKKNHSFSTSKPEKTIYEKLKLLYPSAEFQKHDYPNFPFNVDYYIPEFDLLIEYQGSWTHGTEPFDSSNAEHLRILAEWQEKAKTSQYYTNAIDTWTRRDPAKFSIAQKLDIRYLRLYNRNVEDSIAEIQNFIDKLSIS